MPKLNLEKVFYRCRKNFDNEKFEGKLKKHSSSVLDFESFHVAFAPLKQKVVPNDIQPSMRKTLRKAIMKRSKLRNKFDKERNAKQVNLITLVSNM